MNRICKRCHHPGFMHTHYRAGSECTSGCRCPRYQRRTMLDRLLDTVLGR